VVSPILGIKRGNGGGRKKEISEKKGMKRKREIREKRRSEVQGKGVEMTTN